MSQPSSPHPTSAAIGTPATNANSDFAPFSTEFRDEFYRLLRARRSIRKFKPDAIPQEMIERVLAAAMQAPSGKNIQNWRFYVLRGPKRDAYLEYGKKSWRGVREVLERTLKPSLFQFTERFFYTLGDAPVVIMAYSYNHPDEHARTSMGSVYMAVENLNLACVAEGLGCCTMGAPLEIAKEIDAFLGVDQHQDYKDGHLELICGIVLGYPDHEPPKAKRQLEGRIHYLD